ncbi:thermonuclease family protein [Gymnodinialimonas sp.]
MAVFRRGSQPPLDQDWQKRTKRPPPPAHKPPIRPVEKRPRRPAQTNRVPERISTPAGAAYDQRNGRACASPPTSFDPETASPPQHVRTLRGRAYVVDGYTLKIQKTQIRLFGVDAPEMNHPFGKRAKWAMFELCKGQMVTAEVLEVDDHGRTVAKCMLDDGRDLSAELVKQGLALDWPKYSGGVYHHLETPNARKKLWLAAARQRGHMHVWDKFDAQQKAKASNGSR